MSRVTKWRSRCPDPVRSRQEDVLGGVGGSSGIFLLRRCGPTAFVVKESGWRQTLRVRLSDPHICSCPVFQRENDLCKHICWCLLKVFRLKPDDPRSFQLGLVTREISALLQEAEKKIVVSENARPSFLPPIQQKQNSDQHLERRRATEADICPICLENLLERRHPVTHCRYSCGNLVHINCMLVWAKHSNESSPGPMLKCPLCRGEFGSSKQLKEEARNAPRVFLRNKSQRHGSREKKQENQKIRLSVDNRVEDTVAISGRRRFTLPPIKTSCAVKCSSGMSDDGKDKTVRENALPKKNILHIPRLRIHPSHALLARGQQCCICLSPYQCKEYVSILPGCGHVFHEDCLSVRRKSRSGLFYVCPIDGTRIHPTLPVSESAEADPSPTTEDPSMAHTHRIDHTGDNVFGGDYNVGDRSNVSIPRKTLEASFLVTGLSIWRPCPPADSPVAPPTANGTEKNGGEWAPDDSGQEVGEDGESRRRRRRGPPPPLLVQVSHRNSSNSVEESAPRGRERGSDGGADGKGEGETWRGCRRKHPAPKHQGYLPMSSSGLASSMEPFFSVKALPVLPPSERGPIRGSQGGRSPSLGPRRTNPMRKQEESMRCHRYESPPQPLLWSYHRPKHSHQQNVGEVQELLVSSSQGDTSSSTGGRILQCSRMTLSPKSPPARGPWDDLIYWDGSPYDFGPGSSFGQQEALG